MRDRARVCFANCPRTRVSLWDSSPALLGSLHDGTRGTNCVSNARSRGTGRRRSARKDCTSASSISASKPNSRSPRISKHRGTSITGWADRGFFRLARSCPKRGGPIRFFAVIDSKCGASASSPVLELPRLRGSNISLQRGITSHPPRHASPRCSQTSARGRA
jgi:hypothetical protein